jgi:hypothetical protein
MTTGRRIATLLIGYIPLLHVILCIAIWFIPQPIAVRASAFVLTLYLLPPLAARLGRFQPGTYPMHLGWWWSQQWQTLFNRFPFLDEVLRLVPALYSMWLRLWGSHIGKLVYWAPGVRLLDRGLVDIGDSVVVGASVRISGHLFANDELLIARVTIGASSVIGGFSILAPGVVIGENESTPAAMLLPPHSEFRGERRVPRRSVNAV